jgi:hypothetical protein
MVRRFAGSRSRVARPDVPLAGLERSCYPPIISPTRYRSWLPKRSLPTRSLCLRARIAASPSSPKTGCCPPTTGTSTERHARRGNAPKKRCGTKARRFRCQASRNPGWSTGIGGHSSCFQDRGEYWVSYDRIDSLPKMVDSSFHLAEHVWFDETDWPDAIRRFYDVPFGS